MNEFLAHGRIYLPVLLGAAAISALQLAKRPIAQKMSPLQLLILWFGVAAASFAVAYLMIWGVTWPDVLPGFLRAVLCATAAGVLIQYCNVRAAKCAAGEVSLTAPIQAMTPGLITILGISIGEYPGLFGLLGIALIACGSYILMWDGTPKYLYEYFGPFRHLGRLTRYRELSPEQQSKTLAVCWSLGSASLGTIGLLFSGLFTRRGKDFQGLTIAALIEVSVYTAVYVLWYLLRPDSKHPATEKMGRSLEGFRIGFRWPWVAFLLVMSGGWVLHMWLINPAFQQTYVAHVGTLKRMSVLFSVVLGLFLLGEQAFKGPIWRVVYQPRFWAAILTVLGVLCISADDLPSRISVRFEDLGF